MTLLKGYGYYSIDIGCGIHPGLEGSITINFDHEGIELGFRHGTAERWSPHP